MSFKFKGDFSFPEKYKRHFRYLFYLLLIQIFFGAILSGMRAAIFYPSWPDMNGSFIPQVLFDISEWNVDNVIQYDTNAFMPALIHVLHRNLGYIVFIYGTIIGFKAFYRGSYNLFKSLGFLLICLLITQVILGILTLLYSGGAIPVGLAISHQAVAILLFLTLLTFIYINSQSALDGKS